jgi:formylglycine-generating enzyme required for sulfatase activity
VVWIPPGEFWMGGSNKLVDVYPDPRNSNYCGVSKSLLGKFHKVYVDGFYIGRHEVTVEEYRKFILSGDHQDKLPIYRPRFDTEYNTYPIHEISWNDANAYCDWLSKQTGMDVRLPTEAQWEKAARGGEEKLNWCKGYHNVFGVIPIGHPVATFSMNTKERQAIWNHERYRTNPYGLYDIPGNVSEYCRDWFSPDYFLVSPHANPDGPTTGTAKISKGASQMHVSDDPGDRMGVAPDKKMYAFGFRIAILLNK